MTGQLYVGAGPWAPDNSEKDFGLFRSTDDGNTWQRLTRGLPQRPEVRALAVDPSDPGTVYAATQAGPYRSRDGGESWGSLGLDGLGTTWSVTVHPADSDVLLVGTTDAGVHRSVDGGATWQVLPTIMPMEVCDGGFAPRILRVVLDPSHPHEMYAALEIGGVIRSLDNGHSWSSCNSGLLALAEDDRYKSRLVSDADHEGMMDCHALAISREQPGTLFLACRMGLFRSVDRGESWEDAGINRFSPLTYARDLRVSPHDGRVVLGAFSRAFDGDAGSLYRSDDLGESWRRFDHGLEMDSTLMTVAASPSSDGRVWCATRHGQVVGTEDGGETWLSRALPERIKGVWAIACA